LLEIEDCSIDAVVTDPPYELGFMGKSWDSSGIAYNVEVWRQCLRVLKPGGHILAFGGSRTWHRLAVAVEDAGFELRDSIAWIYGSGFPKSLDVSKAIDKTAGAERNKIPATGGLHKNSSLNDDNWSKIGDSEALMDSSDAVTPDAQKWQGWGTALKPAFEPVVVGRKPLTGTVAANVLEWGVGGLNIDGTRIGTDGGTKGTGIDLSHRVGDAKTGFRKNNEVTQLNAGRWPSNVMLDEFTASLVDQQSGTRLGSATSSKINLGSGGKSEIHGWGGKITATYDDKGGASRFFYVAKASKRDRNEGLDGLEAKQSFGGGGGVGDYLEDVNSASGKYGSEKAPAKNFHPTVKPTELMRNLIRLVTPLGGTVLDPFTGSGSTGKAAILEGMQFVGCELTPEYLPIIEGRINYAVSVKEQEALADDEKLF
jgi:site-specific DNA-methyltransferase (adenine-specific)